MSIDSRLRAAMLLGMLSVPSACSTLGPAPSRPQAQAPATMPAKVPPQVERPAPTTPGQPALAMSSAQGRPGDVVAVSATLTSGGKSIAGTQNDLEFDPKQLAVAATGKGKPDCAANKALGKEGTAFSFLPPGCAGGPSCTGVRALVLSLSNVAAIPSGSVLYTCKVRIASSASPGAHKLTSSRIGFSSPAGDAINGGGVDAVVTVAK